MSSQAAATGGLGVWITGTGAVSCVGIGAQALWQSTLENHSGLEAGLGRVPVQARSSSTQHNSPALEFALPAAREALSDAGWPSLEPGDGLILASTTGQISNWESALIDFIRGKRTRTDVAPTLRRLPLGSLLTDLQRELNHVGPATLVSSSCAAATQALGLAALWLQSGKVERCLVGGVEVLCDLTIHGFRCLQLLASGPCAPFSSDKGGIQLSEGAAFLCLQNKRPMAERPIRLSGVGFSTDAYHMTAPHPQGEGSRAAMAQALASAGLQPQQIDWVHAHGTGSVHNDAAEAAAIGQLFGVGAAAPWVSATKPIHGHTLGASGTLEAVVCVHALHHQMLLPTFGLNQPDPALQLRHPTQAQRAQLRHVLKNTLGFGGANAALVLSAEEGLVHGHA
ncbi:MAG TPA: beta-ketoacyl-[acyl-carrier-protein] synthase family protein [Polyangiaceae bacterium]|nr:beta-ketoacyl-[acyl-carrier-protein] synthase family protein [Polyangiaceae bacterium]